MHSRVLLPSRTDILLHAFVLLILKCSDFDHLLDVLFQIIHLELQSVTMQVLV